MYTEFFGLQRLPFNLTPDPSFLFLPAKHREALAGLTYAVLERKGFVVLTGDAGTGKTTLINSVIKPPACQSGRIQHHFQPHPDGGRSFSKASCWISIFLMSRPVRRNGCGNCRSFWRGRIIRTAIAVLVIDEAHKLSLEVLEEIRLLGNFESAADKFLQILLLGQTELDDLLNRQDLRQLKQRIALRLYIDSPDRLGGPAIYPVPMGKAGGREAPPFTPDALAGIVQWSQGIPRLINSICDTALLMAYGDESPLVGLNYVRDSVSNLALADASSLNIAHPSMPPMASTASNNPYTATPKRDLSDLVVRNGDEMPILNQYDGHKSNSSLLKRLAERFGLPH